MGAGCIPHRHVSSTQWVTVTAVSQADISKTGSAIITLLPGAGGNMTAQFVKQDNITQGTWRGVYGGDGYGIISSAFSGQSYVEPLATGVGIYNWNANTTDVRALQQTTNPSLRVAGVWYAADRLVVDLPFTGSQSHQMAIYFLDWDNIGRAQKVEMVDANGNVLDTRNLSNFGGGVWLIWNVSGHVQLRVTRTAG